MSSLVGAPALACDCSDDDDDFATEETRTDGAEQFLTRAPSGRTMNIQQNLQVDGSVSVASGQPLLVDNITPQSGDSVCFRGNVSVDTGKKLLVNTIHASQSDGLTVSADEDGVTCFASNASVLPGKALFVSEITPHGDAISFNGNIGIRPTGDSINRLWINNVAPIAVDTDGKGFADYQGTTNFEGNVEVSNGKQLTVNGPLVVNGNSTLAGDLSIAPDAMLRINQVSPATTAGTAFTGHVSIDTEKSLFTNHIAPTHDSATINVDGNVTVASTSALTVNTINPTLDATTTHLGGNITIRDLRTLGQTQPIRFYNGNSTQVLCLTFKSNANNAFDAALATGAWVNFKIIGVASGHDNKNVASHYDFFADTSMFVGPGRGFQNTVVAQPMIKYGHNFPQKLQSMNISFWPIRTNPRSIWISMTITSEQNPIFTPDWVDAVVFYDVASTNLDNVACTAPEPAL